MSCRFRSRAFPGGNAACRCTCTLVRSGFTSTTGRCVVSDTFSATLPMTTREIPVRPCVPITMRSTSWRCAYDRIVSIASPSATCQWTFRTSGRSRAATSCRYFMLVIADRYVSWKGTW